MSGKLWTEAEFEEYEQIYRMTMSPERSRRMNGLMMMKAFERKHGQAKCQELARLVALGRISGARIA